MSTARGLVPGTMVAGHWRIMRLLGQGGFGITYEAHRADGSAHAALKEYMPGGLCTRLPGSTKVSPVEGPGADIFQQGLVSFQREAETLARLDHPAIVRIREHFPANDTAYMVLDFIEGGSMKRWLAALGRRPTQQEMDFILQPIIEALVDVHSLPLLHRDLKPDNIMLRTDGSPVLIDFGAVKTLVSSVTRTVGQGTLGFVTEGYAPPEQYVPDGERLLGPWTDVYALAATCYEAVSGAPPQPATLRFVEEGTMPLASMATGDHWRPAFLAGIDQALSLRRQDRPQSMIEFRQAIGLARARTGGEAGLLGLSWPAPAAAGPDAHARPASLPGEAPRTPSHPLPAGPHDAFAPPGGTPATGWQPYPAPHTPPPRTPPPQTPPPALPAPPIPPQALPPQALPPQDAGRFTPLREPAPRRPRGPRAGMIAAAVAGLAVLAVGVGTLQSSTRADRIEAETRAAILDARTPEALDSIARVAPAGMNGEIAARRNELRIDALRGDIARITDHGALDQLYAREPALRSTIDARRLAIGPETLFATRRRIASTADIGELDAIAARARELRVEVEARKRALSTTARLDGLQPLRERIQRETNPQVLDQIAIEQPVLQPEIDERRRALVADSFEALRRRVASSTDRGELDRIAASSPELRADAEARLSALAAGAGRPASALPPPLPDPLQPLRDQIARETNPAVLDRLALERPVLLPDINERRRLLVAASLDTLRRRIAETTDIAELDRIAASAPETRDDVAARKRALSGVRTRTGAAGITPGSGQAFRDCPQCPEMVVVPAGQFTMGSPPEEAQRETDEQTVTIRFARPFAVGRFEITFDEWNACRAEGGCAHTPADEGWGRGRRPVIYVSRDDVLQYLAWLSRKSGHVYRLPSEAEWEYAARAGTTTRYFTGLTITANDANFDNRTQPGIANPQLYRQQTVEVGALRPNQWGLHDVHGNVAEWTEDCYAADNRNRPPDGLPVRQLETTCPARAVRGGAWFNAPQVLRTANRQSVAPGSRSSAFGFRVARSLRETGAP